MRSTATTSTTTTAVEADLNWIVGWKKDDFIGASVLREQKAGGTTRKIAGFEMLDRGIARHGYDVYWRRQRRASSPAAHRPRF